VKKPEAMIDGNLWDVGFNGRLTGDVLPGTVEVLT